MQLLNGLESIANNYDYFILDIWGVLHNGVSAYDTVVPCLEELKCRGKQVCLLTNSPNRAKHISPQLRSMGIGDHLYDHVISSGESTYHELKNYKDQKIYCFYKDEEPTSMEGLNLSRVQTPEEADVALLSHLPRLATAEEYLPILKKCLAKSIPIICANPDKVVDVGGTLYLCAGGVADLYENMGGTVFWHGKPHAPVYDWVFKLFNNPKKTRVLAIGDSIRTDVTGASSYGIDVLWNIVGIHLHEISEQGRINEDKIKQALQGLPHAPTAVLNGLAW